MSTFAISIIIPTYNEQERIDALLSFLKKNSGESVSEIIIADGGSTDETLSIAESHDVKIVRCKKKGRAAQMNEGASEANGNVFYFLHADTTPPKDFVTQITDALQARCRSGCFQLRFNAPHPALKFYGWCTKFPFTIFRFGDQSLFVEKELFQRVGGFDESLMVMEDQKIVRELKKRSTFIVLDSTVTTSARRYKLNGEIRLQLVFVLIVILYYLGVSQKTLVHVYNSFMRK